jgi:hypothetical protein
MPTLTPTNAPPVLTYAPTPIITPAAKSTPISMNAREPTTSLSNESYKIGDFF